MHNTITERIAILGHPADPHAAGWGEGAMDRLRELGFTGVQVNIGWGARPADEPLNLEDVVRLAPEDEARYPQPLRLNSDPPATRDGATTFASGSHSRRRPGSGRPSTAGSRSTTTRRTPTRSRTASSTPPSASATRFCWAPSPPSSPSTTCGSTRMTRTRGCARNSAPARGAPGSRCTVG
ncbi:hypothetical protein G7085_06380 [Tessaracoccus sp. HDW20]|uniref:hypothetical protein n=1 Tax=Tessaracoccus coleopterorum TaxID=2714950 RepID=UPI0018D29D13|nr:hypothetical protein [Tessaracoccus coleopterorum]NHB84354.1 hypothetical protein [Tessaracoccus coleopterorum]